MMGNIKVESTTSKSPVTLDWIEQHREELSILLKRRPEVRAGWLDKFIMRNLSRYKLELDKEAYDVKVGELFDLTRELSLFLKLRHKFEDAEFGFHLNTFTPLVRAISDKSSEVLPGSYSGSRKHLEFKLNVFKRIEREHPVLTDERGFAIDNGYGHDTSRLLSLTGYVPSEIGVRPLSNISQRKDHGLSNTIDPDFLRMQDDFLLALYGLCEAKSIRIEGKSQSGLPLRAYGKGIKTVGFENAVINLTEILDRARDGHYLLEHHDILLSFLAGNRQSPDAGGKKRYITTVSDNAAGLAGATLQDNHPRLAGVPQALARHFATMRYRFVWGGNSTANAIVNCIATSCRHTYGHVFEFTFKHRGADDLVRKIKSFYGKDELENLHKSECDLVVIDVTNFDLDYPRDVLKKYVDFFEGTKIYDFFGRVAFAPSVQGALDKDSDSKEPIVNGDLFNFEAEHYMNSGLPSGWSWVSDAGKIMALNIYYCLVKAKLLNSHSFGQLIAFLRGDLDYGCLNLGDDNVILCPHGQFEVVLEALKQFSVWLVDLEPGARFIGFPLFFDSFGNFKISHDPASYVTNWLTPERAIGGKFTKYWAYGLVQRERVYSDAPIVHSFRKIIMEEWQRVYGTDLNAIIYSEAEKQKRELETASKEGSDVLEHLYSALHTSPNPGLANLILNDVIRDTSVLQWKWEPEDIREAFGISLEEIESRPHVRFTERVLSMSGYERLFTRKEANDYYGDIWVHAKVGDEHLSQLINIHEIDSQVFESANIVKTSLF